MSTCEEYSTDVASMQRPIALFVTKDAIPDGLRSDKHKQWVVWRYEFVRGKRTKVPYRPQMKGISKASVTNPDTWEHFGVALTVSELCTEHPYDGIGFVLTKDDPFVGIDLDHCINEQGKLEEWAQAIVDAVDSYTEVSPSGEGIRIITRGTLPGGDTGRRSGPIELYASGRYLTITGHHVEGTCRTIEERQGEIESVHRRIVDSQAAKAKANKTKGATPSYNGNGNGYKSGLLTNTSPQLTDTQVLELCRKARNAPKFRALWGGDTSGYPSHSEAEAALCSKIGFYTQDRAQIERMVSESALVGDKWGKRSDYRERTIDLALNDQTKVYHVGGTHSAGKNGDGNGHLWDRNTSEDAGDAGEARGQFRPVHNGLIRLSDVAPEHVQWLWPQRIPLGKITILDGDPGLGKSLITCDLAARVTTGREMPDGVWGDLQGPAGVVMLSGEDGIADTIRPRADAAGADTTRIAVLQTVMEGETGLIRMPCLDDLTAIEQAIAVTEAKLLIVDPIMAYLPSDTRSYTDHDVRRVLAPLAELGERTGVAILMLRHLNKAPGGSALYRGGGSIAFIGAARSGLLVGRDPADESGARCVLASNKSNLGLPARSLAYHTEETGNGAPCIIWDGESDHTASDLLGSASGNEQGARNDAKAFLRDLLYESGGEMPSKKLSEKSQTGVEGASDCPNMWLQEEVVCSR